MNDKQTEAIKKIPEMIDWYFNKGFESNIEELLRFQDRLAVNSYYIAEYSAEIKKNYNIERFERKIEFSRQRQEFRNKHKFSDADSKISADIKVESLYKKELESEAMGYKSDKLLGQINKILEAVKQRISHLKKEKEYYENQ